MLNRTIAKFLFYGVAIVLLAWTSSLTYSFLSMALPGQLWIVPLLGLVVFEVGMISWLFVFLSHAEGAIQRAVGIILCLFNFVGVGLMTISEILLSGQTMAAAPEMLAALKAALADFGDDYSGPTIDALRAAITKAEGRG